MASNDLYIRSDTDKGETSPDKDLRLRSDSDKVAAPAVDELGAFYMQRNPFGLNIQTAGQVRAG